MLPRQLQQLQDRAAAAVFGSRLPALVQWFLGVGLVPLRLGMRSLRGVLVGNLALVGLGGGLVAWGVVGGGVGVGVGAVWRSTVLRPSG